MTRLDADVIVVGFGPVGQATALALGQAGHQVLVVERYEEKWPLPRAGHFDHEIMRIFQGLGLAGPMSDVAEPADKYVMFDSDGEILRELPRTWVTPSGWPASYHFYQPELEQVLHEAIARCPQVTLLRGWEVSGVADGPVASAQARHLATGQTRSLQASYLIGADGANSTVRPAVARTCHDLGFRADWLVVDVRVAEGVDPGIPSTGQYCDPRRPNHAAHLHGRYLRWEFMVLESDDREELCGDDSIWRLLSPWLARGAAELIRRSIYTFSSKIAEPWSQGRIALAGDAAHLMPPFLGQGMCSGLRDGATLSWMLDLVLRGISAPRLLHCYETERAPHVRRFIEESVRVGQLVCITDKTKAAERDRVLRASPTQETPLQVRLGPGVVSGAGTALAGHLSVQPVVASPDGTRTRLDSLLGPGFQLLGLGRDPRARLSQDSLRLLDRLGCRTAAIGPQGRPDVTGDWSRWMTGAAVAAVVVRPDHYVFGAVPRLSGLDALLAELGDLLCLT